MSNECHICGQEINSPMIGTPCSCADELIALRSRAQAAEAEVARLGEVNKKYFGELECDDEFITCQKNRIAELEQEVARLKDNNQTNYLGETK